MVPEGARIAIAVSGGLDSLCLAYLLHRHSRTLRRPPELLGLHVRLDGDGPTAGLDPEVDRWLAALEIVLVEVPARLDGSDRPPLDCHRCATVRRRSLLEAAEARRCSHLALGHHADDVVETWLMSLFYTGNGEAMPPVRSYFDGAVTVVRPLFELQRRELERLGRLGSFPVQPERCRNAERARRRRVGRALAALGRDERLVRRQLFWAVVRQGEGGGQEGWA